MKISKVLAAIAAAATAVSMIAVSTSATNWANASYADDDPNTVKVISVDENKASFTATADGQAAKLRITVGELLEDADIANIKSATWTVTYDIPEGTATANGVGGGTYFGCKNSTGYWIAPIMMTTETHTGAAAHILLQMTQSSCSLQRFLLLIPSWYSWIGPITRLSQL